MINPDGMFDASAFGFSQARIDNGIMSLSGQVGVTSDLTVAGETVDSQGRKAFENLGMVLEAAGKEFADVSKVTTFIVDLDQHVSDYRQVWTDVFDAPYPCHTLIGVDQLSPFADGRLLVEVDAEVAMGEER